MISLKDAAAGAKKLLTSRQELEIADLTDRLAKAERRNTELEEEKQRRDEMTFQFPFWFKKSDPNPYCAVCWEVEQVQLHLNAPFKHTDEGFGYACLRCEKVFRSSELLPGTKLAEFRNESSVAFGRVRSSLREELDKFF
jgi:hypothetical protein